MLSAISRKAEEQKEKPTSNSHYFRDVKKRRREKKTKKQMYACCCCCYCPTARWLIKQADARQTSVSSDERQRRKRKQHHRSQLGPHPPARAFSPFLISSCARPSRREPNITTLPPPRQSKAGQLSCWTTLSTTTFIIPSQF